MSATDSWVVLRDHRHGDNEDDLCGQVVTWVSSRAAHFAWTAHDLTFPASARALHEIGSEPKVRLPFGIYDRDTGELAGYAELGDIDRKNSSTRLSRFVIHPEHRGRGFGSASIRLLVKQVALLGLHRIDLVVAIDNVAAIRAYRAAGFTLEGTLHDSRCFGGEYRSMYLMAKILGPEDGTA